MNFIQWIQLKRFGNFNYVAYFIRKGYFSKHVTCFRNQPTSKFGGKITFKSTYLLYSQGSAVTTV